MNASQRHARQHARCGLTLVELMVTIGVGSVIFGLTVTLLASILRTERTARRHLAETQTIGRLGLQFRRDAHGATEAEVIPPTNSGPAGLRLAINDGSQVEYQWVDGGLRRTRSQADRPPQHEQFILPSIAAVKFGVDNAGAAPFVVLRLESQPGDSQGRVGRNLTIEAHIRGASPAFSLSRYSGKGPG